MEYVQSVKDMKRMSLPVVADNIPGATECNRSGYCCWKAPGELTSADLDRLAVKFSLSREEVFKQYCVVDTYGASDRFILRLARKHQTKYLGKMIPAEETYSLESPCTFLDKERGQPASCMVHDSKPTVCANFKCWMPAASDVEIDEAMQKWTPDELKKLGWDGINPDE